MLDFIIPQLKLWLGAFAALLCIWVGHHFTKVEYEAKTVKQANEILTLQKDQLDKAVTVLTKYADRSAAIKKESQSIQQDVKSYVSPSSDSGCIIPIGFVRIHDKAANGNDSAAGNSNEASAGVELSAVAETVAENYAICHQNAEQLTALQSWVQSVYGQKIQTD
jgi:hypothetical protein